MQPAPAKLKAAIIIVVAVVSIYLYLGHGYVTYVPGETIGRDGLGRAHSMQRAHSMENHPERDEMVSRPDMPWPYIDCAILSGTIWGIWGVARWARKRGMKLL
jgi:hypothetical protein